MILIKSAQIVDPGGKYDNTVQDVFVKNGKIAAIDKKLTIEDAQIIKAEGLHISIGWLDCGTYVGEPGLEQRETKESITNAAAAGGFTALLIRPDVNPVVDNKGQVAFMQQNAAKNLVDIEVLASVRSAKNNQLFSEMYELNEAGVKGFCELQNTNFDAAFIMRALLYIKGFSGLLVFDPVTNKLSKNGQINEGEISTMMGVPGMPSIAEKLAIYQVIQLVDYTNSRLHIQNVSTKEGVALIKAAKKKNLAITASVSAPHLVLEDKDALGYNVNAKVSPPFRTKKDKTALIKGLVDGTLDFVNSNHQSIEQDAKKVEFPYADFGVASIENTYSLVNQALGDKVTQSKIVVLLAKNNRQIFDIKSPLLEEGQTANLTLFVPTKSAIFEVNDIQSKGKNNPFVGHEMKGVVLGVINGKQQLIK